MEKMPILTKRNNQIVGNMGLYYVCLQLSRNGWNVMPTTRNARGIDIVAYDFEATPCSYVGIQVKALSKKSPVPLGQSLDRITGDFWVIVNNLCAEPQAYILLPDEVKLNAHHGQKDKRDSYWLQPKAYMQDEYHNRWDRIRQTIH